jgi:hypothetical protein
MILEQRMPPKLANETKRIALVVDAEWLKRIAGWRKLQEGFPTLSDSVRQLVDIGLDALADGYKPKKTDAGTDKPKPKKPKS